MGGQLHSYVKNKMNARNRIKVGLKEFLRSSHLLTHGMNVLIWNGYYAMRAFCNKSRVLLPALLFLEYTIAVLYVLKSAITYFYLWCVMARYFSPAYIYFLPAIRSERRISL